MTAGAFSDRRCPRERDGRDAWLEAAADFDDHEESAQLFGPWAVYHFLIEGQPIVHWYLEARKRQLSNTELTWLRAHQVSWLSVWEVLDVEFGRSITLRDLLSDEERTVQEVTGSKTLEQRFDFSGLRVELGV